MNNDPFGEWTQRRRVKWAIIAALCVSIFGPGFVKRLRPPQFEILDFYQEWSSARGIFTELPVYAPLDQTVPAYLGMRKDPGTAWYWDVNVHPPTSILLAVPIQWLDYWTAFFVWNIVSLVALGASLWLIVRELGIKFSPLATLPVVSVLLLCDPLRQQVTQGQLNLVLLLILTGIWVADRRGKPVFAGFLLALATAIKLFPGFLIFYFLLRKNWKACQATALAFIGITLLTVAVTGTEACAAYITEILPTTGRWRPAWNNASVVGFWFKLFDPVQAGRELTPLTNSPLLARAGAVLSVIGILAMLAATRRSSSSVEDSDQQFSLFVTAMLLVSPVTWEHYFLLLILPLAIQWTRTCMTPRMNLMFATTVTVLCLPVILLCNIVIPGGFFAGSATVMHTVTILSLQFYALAGLYGMQFMSMSRNSIPAAERSATA